MFKGNNENTKAKSLTSFWCFIVNFEHISQIFLVFPVLTWSKQSKLAGFLCKYH